MNSVQPPSAKPRAPAAASGTAATDGLGSRVITGATWILIQSILAHLLSLSARIVVLREISNTDFPKGMWAMSACAFLVWLEPGFSDVLVQRSRRRGNWTNAAFWWSILSAVVTFAVAAALGTSMAWGSHDWRILPLVLTFTLAMILQHLTAVWGAELVIGFRFRLGAAISMAGATLIALASIIMAYANMGPWTLVVPVLIGNILIFALSIGTTQFRPHRPQPRVMRRSLPFLKKSLILSIAVFFSGLIWNADNFFLGMFRQYELTAYATAFTLSLSLVQLLTRSLRNVLLPAFTAMEANPARRDAAYLEALRAVSLIAIPSVILVIPASQWVLTTVFPTKGLAATPLFQILLLGMGFTVIYAVAFASMQSRGLYRRFLWSNVTLGVLFCAVVAPAAALGGARVVAMTVASYYALTSIIIAILAAKPIKRTNVQAILVAAGGPFLSACFAAWLGVAFASGLKLKPAQFLYGVSAVLMGTAIFAVLAVALFRHTLQRIIGRVGHVVPARLQQGALVKSAIKPLVDWLPTPVVYHIHGVAHSMSSKRGNLAHLEFLKLWPDPPQVVGGPFKGMLFTRETFSSALVPSLLGTYELEVHAVVEWLCGLNPDVVVDIGAGEGYYAVGMALRNPRARVVAFESFKPANHVLGKVARQNGVESDERFVRPGICTTAKLRHALLKAARPVVICDCEGSEDALLDLQAVPELRAAAILVELHDHFNPGVSGRLRQRFAATHDIEAFHTRGRAAGDLPGGVSLTTAEVESLVVEQRGVVQTFFLLKPRQWPPLTLDAQR